MTTPSETELLRGFFDRSAAVVEAALETLLPSADASPQVLHEAMRWSVFAGGKRLRPALVLAAGQAFGASEAALIKTACALEMVHTYSLIHDDLPAMDDDELRRGRPTCHVRYGEANAILAGDALQTLAFQAIAEDENLAGATRARVVAELAQGAYGMVAGQVLDLEAETRAGVTGAELERIHRHKTGALIVAAARCGAVIGGAEERELAAVTRYAAALGLLFQITDDLLDVTATAQDLGKTPGKDAKTGKATYPALYGLEGAQDLADVQLREARAALGEVARPTPLLDALAQMTRARQR
jgi:geranylgeranyl pyrophosphate synthase